MSIYLFTCKNCSRTKYSGELTLEETGRVSRADLNTPLLISCECRAGHLSTFYMDAEKQKIVDEIHALESKLICLDQKRRADCLPNIAKEEALKRRARNRKIFAEEGKLRTATKQPNNQKG